MDISVNKEKMYREYIKCIKNPYYFIENYFKTYAKGKNYETITLTEKQRDFFTSLINKEYVLARSARQCGITTTIEASLLCMLLFSEDKTHIAYVSNSLSSVKLLREKLSNDIRHIQKLFNIDNDIITISTKYIIVANVTIDFLTIENVYGFYNYVIIDNADFIDKERLKSLCYTCNMHKTPFVMCSTPSTDNVKNGYFKEIWNNQEHNNWKKIIFSNDDILNERCKLSQGDISEICNIWSDSKLFVTEILGLFL